VRPWHSVCVALAASVALWGVSWSNGFAAPSFELGVRGGLSLAHLTGSDLETSEPIDETDQNGFHIVGTVTSSLKDSRAGFTGGGYAMLHVNQQFGVRLEALFSPKGGKGDNSGTLTVFDSSNQPVGSVDVGGTNEIRLNYFEIPVLGVVSFPTGPRSTIEVFAGPSIGLRSKAEFKQEVTLSAQGGSITQSQTSDIGKETKSTDFAGVLGAGFSYRLGAHVLFAEARWTPGFSKIDDTGSNTDWKNSAFGVSAGVGLSLATMK
jgi:outer membrane protein with beta-barrel domain